MAAQTEAADAHKDPHFTRHEIGIGKGAGAGGGLGLNAAGMKEVKHFAAGGGKGKGPGTTPEMEAAWAKLINDDDSTMSV